MAIKSVLFDLGETLLNYGLADANELLHQAAHLSYDYLKGEGLIQEDKLSFQRYNWGNVWAIKIIYYWGCITNREFDALALLKKRLGKIGIKITDEQLEEMVWLWYKPLGDLAKIEDHLHDYLRRLQEMGLQLAIISNTFSPRSVLDRQLEHFDLIRFFSVRMYSSETVYRKPDRRIFQATLSKLGATAAEAVMVGDREREDIKGARRLGIRTIWKRGTTNSHLNIKKADAVIESIGELPRLIERWREEVGK